MRLRYILTLLLLIPAWALAVDTPTYEKQIQRSWSFYDSLSSQWATADSNYQVCAYPSEEPDTAGKRIDFVYLGGLQHAWKFEIPDSTEVWDFYIRDRDDGLSWTALPLHQDLRFEGRHAPEGWINDTRAFASGVLPAALAAEPSINLQQGDSTGVMRMDLLRAIEAMIFSSLSVQPGDTTTTADDIFLANDGFVRVQDVPLLADTLYVSLGARVLGIIYGDTLQPVGTHLTMMDSVRVVGGLRVTEDAAVDGNLTVDGLADLASITAGGTLNMTSPLGIHQIEGSLTIGNDLIVEDNLDVDGRLDVDEHADIADSTQFGSSFGAADSLAAAAVAHGWIAIDGAYLFQHTLTGGDASDIIKVPGARSWNTFVFATSESNSSSTNAANNFAFAEVTGVGEITLLRGGGTTGNATYNILVLKAR